MTDDPAFALGEVEALVLKAYRGAGFSWGMAQEAGKAAAWLAAHRLPALNMFATLLAQTNGLCHRQLAPDIKADTWPDEWSSPSGLLCPVVAGTLLSDLAPVFAKKPAAVKFSSVQSALILLPFIATLRSPAMLTFADLRVWLYRDVDNEAKDTGVVNNDVIHVEIIKDRSSTTSVERQDVFLAFDERFDAGFDERTLLPAKVAAMRGAGTAESIALLEHLAHQTYVPATQASRESGAGAGLNDDD